MKKLLLLLLLIAFSYLLKAQSVIYKSFKVDLGFGYAIPTVSNGGGTKAGVTFTVEPHYRVTDDIAIGLRIEGAGLGYKDINNDVKVSVLTSYCATGEYYLVKGDFRPLVGVGLGFFSQSSLSSNSNNGNATLVSGGTKFGLFPRLGFETGHFRVTVEYNIVSNNSSYVSFKLGFFLGGGKKQVK